MQHRHPFRQCCDTTKSGLLAFPNQGQLGLVLDLCRACRSQPRRKTGEVAWHLACILSVSKPSIKILLLQL
jgi:hypothetical protein